MFETKAQVLEQKLFFFYETTAINLLSKSLKSLAKIMKKRFLEDLVSILFINYS
jgi:hypothetical protein